MAHDKKEMALIWRHSPKDFRSVIDGTKYVMYYGEGGSCLCPIAGLPDDVYAEKLAYAQRREAEKSVVASK